MGWLTVFSLRWSLYSFLSFLGFVAVLNPVARYGVLLIFLGWLCVIGITVYKDYTEYYLESCDSQIARMKALTDNAFDILGVILSILVSAFLATY